MNQNDHSAADMLRIPHAYEPMGDALMPGVSATCRVCLGNELVEAHTSTEETTTMRRLYAEALAESEGDPGLATVIAMTRWLERGQ